jgi:hypothetical protein
MKLKLPFFNREQYILLKAYTAVKYLATHAPVTLSKDAVPSFPELPRTESGFKTCYSHVASLKRSATVVSPCEIRVKSDGNHFWYDWPSQEHLDARDHVDGQYKPKGMFISKINLPWSFECNKPDINFVMCSHVFNDTEMHIPSGLVTFSRIHQSNVFNYIPKKEIEYMIPFKKPLVYYYPVSDLPLVVECEYDSQKFHKLRNTASSRPCFRNSDMRLLHLSRK